MVFCLRHRKYPAKRPSPQGSSAPPKKPSEAEIKTWYRVALDKIVAARLEQESSTAQGEPIFLSHYISQGQFRHWVMHTYGHKYELRQRRDSDGGYAAKISSSSLDLNTYRYSLLASYSPRVGSYFYSMIGWTTLPKERIDEHSRQLSASFGTYGLLRNNCHDFLQRLADTIVTTRAPDWAWFRYNTVSNYHYILASPLDYWTISAANRRSSQ
ncbi:hypothetical protein CBS115989_3648 [Aspergillus niger]|nr:hypothetical protein CBS115989_3648 [Aspergillus niger]KAI2831744.1 hypothetical protein CBS133816_2336 [Aspergillus niger]KAI2861296.1 hypothetical protein CBS11232_932 [Aspergillus niger]KAI2891944.1 hypothetical protein CBS11852_5951 [Aspergillus niger]KAI2940183.1 hypothetical protein CBS147321_6322 [Aspergillus niger]